MVGEADVLVGATSAFARVAAPSVHPTTAFTGGEAEPSGAMECQPASISRFAVSKFFASCFSPILAKKPSANFKTLAISN